MGTKFALKLSVRSELIPCCAVETGNIAIKRLAKKGAGDNSSVTSVTISILIMTLVQNTSPDQVQLIN